MTTNGADDFDVLVQPFAVGIHALFAARTDGSVALTPYQDARVREAISVLVRKACDVIFPAARMPEVSIAAANAAAELGIDLRTETWHSQTKFDKGRLVFHYEHMQPVGAVVQRLASAATPDEVVEILRNHLRLAWITKAEDKELRRLGYQSTRPDPDAAYAAAGITLLGSHSADVRQAPLPTSHEPSFMPVAAGDTFATVQIGLCLGGLVQIFSDAGSSIWSVGDDTQLLEAQCRAYLARTSHGPSSYREAALFNASSGTLLLQPRSPREVGDGQLTMDSMVIQLAPPEEPRESWSEELTKVLARAVESTLSSGAQMRVESGGWNAASAPFCSVELASLADGIPVLYFEASPEPVGARWWSKNVSKVDAATVRMTLKANDFGPDQVAMLLRDAMHWDIGPWDLAVTYVVPPVTQTKV